MRPQRCVPLPVTEQHVLVFYVSSGVVALLKEHCNTAQECVRRVFTGSYVLLGCLMMPIRICIMLPFTHGCCVPVD